MSIKYGVVDQNTRKFYREGKVAQFYATKDEAKTKRRELNGEDKNGQENFAKFWRITSKDIGEAG